MRSARLGLPVLAAFVSLSVLDLVACGGDDAPAGDTPGEDAGGDGESPPPGPLVIAPAPSRGAAIAIASADDVVVAVNRASGTISVFRATFPDDGASARLVKQAEVEVGAEPWQVALSPDGEAAYVVLRKDRRLVKVGGLRGAPSVVGSVAVGSEPTAVALTPGGTRAWVANWVDGTLSGVDTQSMTVTATVDLNVALVQTGLVGAVAPRPSLAHPRSLAITNDGDGEEDDESIYVTEYYAQRTAAEAPDGANADVAKSGLLYRVRLADRSVSTIRLAPRADIGFRDSAGGVAGCYPNQLQSITIRDRYAYVASICASPRGPIGVVASATPPDVSNVKTTTHGLVSVVDLAADAELPAATASLHQVFDAEYGRLSTPDDASRRYAAVPMDVGFVPDSGVAYVVANAADAVFRVKYDLASASAVAEVGSSRAMFIDLATGIDAPKRGLDPIGIATPHADAHKRFAFVANETSRNVTVLDFNTQSVAGGAAEPVVEVSAALPSPGSADDRARLGKRFFGTATGRWSLKGQGWNGCQSCHMDGLSDNVTWFFARGPRQSTSLDGSFSKKDKDDQRIFNWTAIFDEVADFEANTRGVSGGVGAIVSQAGPPADAAHRITDAAHAGLAGSSEALADTENPLTLGAPSVLDDWAEIKTWIQRVRPPRAPTNVDPAKVAEGRALFASEGSCGGCHGGDKWTISTRFYTPSAAASSALTAKAWTPPAGFPASLLPASSQRFMRYAGANAAAFDQLQCILRPVGSFGKADALMGASAELRQDMTTTAQGDEAEGRGFNPPSLFGVSVGAPYLHAGGAATLESLFATGFSAHHGALAPNFLTESDPAARRAKVEALVHFLLAIDEEAATVAAPAAGSGGGDFCAR